MQRVSAKLSSACFPPRSPFLSRFHVFIRFLWVAPLLVLVLVLLYSKRKGLEQALLLA